MNALRWGILGTGSIASQFVEDLGRLEDAEVVAVGSRSATGADGFGERHGIAHRHGSYDALVADEDVDAIYVATPHPGHAEHALLAIGAGRHVLVEKPFTLNGEQAREVFDAARERGVFVMEAMWTRFLPHVLELRRLVQDGSLGEIRAVHADFGRRFPDDPTSRLLDPELGGGALLDIGVYPVAFACMLLGAPTSVTAASVPASTGVDGHNLDAGHVRRRRPRPAGLLDRGRPAHPRAGRRDGRRGRSWTRRSTVPPRSPWSTHDGGRTRHEYTDSGIGLRHQAVEVARCVAEGLTESPMRTAADTLTVMDLMDDVRRQIGLRYPQE